MISVRSLQRSEGDVSDHKEYIILISITRRIDLRKLVSQFLSYRDETKIFTSIAGNT